MFQDRLWDKKHASKRLHRQTAACTIRTPTLTTATQWHHCVETSEISENSTCIPQYERSVNHLSLWHKSTEPCKWKMETKKTIQAFCIQGKVDT
jgi:hypothetical protein